MKAPLIADYDDLNTNLEKIESYLNNNITDDDFNEMSEYIRRGHNFIRYRIGNEFHFAPSRFVGYKNNSLSKHRGFRLSHSITGTETDRVLSSNYLLGSLSIDKDIENQYILFCKNLSIIPANRKRKYWTYNEDLEPLIKLPPFFEGTIEFRTHKSRERNRKIVRLAKSLFKKKHDGKLFCEKCGFCFEDTYGEIGKDFIEAHHITSLAQINGNHEVAVDDFMMVCSNCHSMLHRKILCFQNSSSTIL